MLLSFHRSRLRRLGCLALAMLPSCEDPMPAPREAAGPAAAAPAGPPGPGQLRWREAQGGAVRGVTVGPIESALHPDHGYGSERCLESLREARRMGATWVSITPFGRVWDLQPSGIDPSFEARFEVNRDAVATTVRQAHALGLKVMLVPHLWVETGGWRAEIDPGDDQAWARWAQAYEQFVSGWARVAADTGVDLMSVGVELRSWVTTARAPSFQRVIDAVRAVYAGPITYAANWDDVVDTVVLGELDVIGINAFYPLAEQEGASFAELLAGGARVREEVRELSASWDRPVLFTEIGYTTRPDPALRPWEWPDHMQNVRVDQYAQAQAYAALLAPFTEEPWFAGFFVWRVYADPNDTSQEAEWGFNPRGKLAELVMRDAFRAHWAADGERPLGASLHRFSALSVGVY